MKYLWILIVLSIVGCAPQADQAAAAGDAVQAEATTHALTLPEGFHFMRNRAGLLRVRGAALREEGAAEVLHGLARDTDDREVRVALAEALIRTPDGRGQLALSWLTSEADTDVQSTLLHGLRRAPADIAEQAVGFALASAHVELRVAALTALGHFEPSSALLAQAAQGAQDGSSDVRAAALTALQVHGADQYVELVAAGLSDASPEVRAAAIRATAALAPEMLATPELVDELSLDGAPAVQRALRAVQASR